MLLQAVLSIGGSVTSVLTRLADRYLGPLRTLSLPSEEEAEGEMGAEPSVEAGLVSDPNVSEPVNIQQTCPREFLSSIQRQKDYIGMNDLTCPSTVPNCLNVHLFIPTR